MTTSIDYYFTCVSPFTFLGHDALMEVAARHGCKVNFKPFNMYDVWEVSGSVMPMKRTPTRQRYRLVELQRVAELRGLDIVLKPTHFPTDPTLGDHCTIAIIESGGDPAAFVRSIGEALWIKDQLVSDETVIGDLIEVAGFDRAAIMEKAASQKVLDIRAANTREAIDNDAIGAPAYVYKDEVFWGQDRIDYLDRMIATGREAFIAE